MRRTRTCRGCDPDFEDLMADKMRETLLAASEPAAGEAGRTGDWRSYTPVINHEKCSRKETCLLCWMYCPDGVISRQFPLEIDLEYCKGCGICAEECPRKAITMVNGRSPDQGGHDD